MTNDNPWETEPTDEAAEPPQPPRKRLSRGVKILLFFSGLAGCGLFCCCGGFVYLAVQVNNSQTSDPIQIQAIADEIAKLDRPANFTPHLGMDWKQAGIPRAMPIHQFAAFGWEGDFDRGQLVLLQVTLALPLANETELLAAFESQNPEVWLPELLPLRTVSDRSSQEFPLDGRTATVEFATGMDRLSQQTREARLTVADPDRRTVRRIVLRRRKNEFDDETVRQLLLSIRWPETAGND